MNISDERIDDLEDEIPDEVDFSQGVRGAYADRFDRDTIAVVLAPDVARVFPDAKSVNEALRLLIRTSEAVEQARAS
jgi:hypothetical protein